jgi:hypothetical protein
MNNPVASYPLVIVNNKVDKDEVTIRENARRGAEHDFGWGPDDILKFIKTLRQRDLISSNQSDRIPNTMVDSYIKNNEDGERVFIHFYVDKDGKLIINSCHSPRI